MVKPSGPSPYMRKSMKKEHTEYPIYGILYDDAVGDRSVALSAAESNEEAVGMLEKALVEGKGYERMKGDLNAEVIDTGFKTSKKGLIFGFDVLSHSLLD
jgi:hypothetical protein